MGLLDTEVAKWKRAFGLLGGIPKTFKNNPRNAETMDAIFGLGGIVPGIGDVVSAAEAKYRYDQGDMLGAGLAGVGALPLVPSMAGMFIGKGAKTWDAIKASEAMQMEKAGKTPREIWAQTGNWKGPDGQWRQEIPDNEMVVTGRYKPYVTYEGKFQKLQGEDNDYYAHPRLQDVIKHDHLYAAYPDATLIKFNATINEELPNKGYIGENFSNGRTKIPFITDLINIMHRPDVDLKPVLGHEITHSIQSAEGFASGAVPNKGVDYDAYKLFAGEAEARATQARMNMDTQQRLATFPEDSYDVPMDQLIVRFGDGPAMSTGRPRNHLGQGIPPTPYELAHAEAQRVAALPVEQGGLGLPPDNTYIDRAKAMGMDISAYRGAAADNMTGNYETMWSGGNSDIANAYIDEVHGFENGVVMPLKVSNKIPTYDIRKVDPYDLKPDEFGNPQAIGKYLNSDDMPSGTQGSVINAPRNLYRSRFAAFNPAKRDSADLLAGLAPWALPVGATLLGGSFLLPPEEY